MRLSLISAFIFSASTYSSAWLLYNVTISAADSSLQYVPSCPEATQEACNGAWWKWYDPRFYNGVAMVAGDPSNKFGSQTPVMAYNFQGTAVYAYQWVNQSASTQYWIEERNPVYANWSSEYIATVPNESTNELVSVNTYTVTDLDPSQSHLVNLVQYSTDGKETYIVFDYMIVTMSQAEPGDIKQGTSKHAVLGIVLGSMFAVFILISGWLIRRHIKREKSMQAEGRQRWEEGLADYAESTHSSSKTPALSPLEPAHTTAVSSIVTLPIPAVVEKDKGSSRSSVASSVV